MTGPAWRDAQVSHLLVASHIGDTWPVTACGIELRFPGGAPARIAWAFVTCPKCLDESLRR